MLAGDHQRAGGAFGLVLCQVCSVQKVAGIFVDNKANIFSPPAGGLKYSTKFAAKRTRLGCANTGLTRH